MLVVWTEIYIRPEHSLEQTGEQFLSDDSVSKLNQL